MKHNYFLTLLAATLFAGFAQGQTIIARWNFNGTSVTEVAGGSISPSTLSGNGSASLVGGTTATFASGVASGGSSDPVTTAPPNYGWNTTTYAAAGTENKGRGVQFNVSTVGQSNIFFMFDQRLSNTAANTWVVQYTTDGSNWVDAQTFSVTPAETGTGDTWYNQRTVDFSAVTALNNNANAAFRIVAAFDPSTNDYLAARSTSSYGPAGTSRFDMVTVSSGQLSTNGFERNALSIYPNPSNNVVNFSQAISGQVLNINGQVLMSLENASNINVSALNAGMYFIKTNEGTTQKLMVK